MGKQTSYWKYVKIVLGHLHKIEAEDEIEFNSKGEVKKSASVTQLVYLVNELQDLDKILFIIDKALKGGDNPEGFDANDFDRVNRKIQFICERIERITDKRTNTCRYKMDFKDLIKNIDEEISNLKVYENPNYEKIKASYDRVLKKSNLENVLDSMGLEEPMEEDYDDYEVLEDD